MEGGVERSFIDPQDLIRGLLDRIGNRVAVHRIARAERLQDQHVERARNEFVRLTHNCLRGASCASRRRMSSEARF